MTTDHSVRQRELYRSIWRDDPAYGTRQADVIDTVEHRIIPHMNRVAIALHRCVIDFGAGDGRFLMALRDRDRCDLGIGVDVHEPTHVPSWLTWRACALWDLISDKADYAISTDTLEHLPREMVPNALSNISQSAPHGFVRISTRQDIYGTERGLHLHETVEEPEWWIQKIHDAGIVPGSWRVYPGYAVEIWW
jgi:hypothetical protein